MATGSVCVLLTLPIMARSDTSSDAVLRSVYDGYDTENGCWRARSDSPGGYCCLKIDRQDRVETDRGSRLYVLLTGGCYDREGKPADTHASPGMVGALVAEFGPGGTKILAGDPRIPMGAWGSGPTDWAFVKLGPADYWGWLNTLGYSGQGRTESTYVILAPYGQRIRDIANNLGAGFDDAGACSDEDNCKPTSIETQLEIDSIQLAARVFPLRVTVSGQIAGREIAAKTWTLPFDTASWSYSAPTDWPLARD